MISFFFFRGYEFEIGFGQLLLSLILLLVIWGFGFFGKHWYTLFGTEYWHSPLILFGSLFVFVCFLFVLINTRALTILKNP